MATRALEAEEAAELPPLARVHRGRAAIALSVTMAALPLLALDNLPATASPSDGGADDAPAEAVAEAEPSTTEWVIETTTTEAPTTTAAPTTTSTTEAPPTTEAAAEVQAAAAPAPTTTTAPPAPPTTAAPAPRAAGDPDDPATWERLAQCESGGNWSANTGNGYYGGLQFSLASWHDVGGTGYPHQASKAEQIERGRILQARYGWGQWPHCSRELGYR
jgi:hypothetical protein